MDRPLVTMYMACYNQEWCIGDALDGAFSQSYSPLEIVIVDDCSTDRTWSIICEKVDEYCKINGHHTIVTFRNPFNVFHAAPEVKRSVRAPIANSIHGDLVVVAEGDDISCSNRVESLVKEFVLRSGRVSYIQSGGVMIDRNGNRKNDAWSFDLWNPIGAAGAFDAGVFREQFVNPLCNCWGDWVLSRRCMMKGDAVEIPDVLVKYRVGCGVSASKSDYQHGYLARMKIQANTFRQIMKDLEDNRPTMTEARYLEIKEHTEPLLKQTEAFVVLVESDSIVERWRAFKVARFPRLISTGNLAYFLCVLPKCIGRPLVEMYWSLRNRVKGL